jgi:hypothetical protein
MIRKTVITAALCAFGATSLFADFTYEQSSKITGGMMAGMMKFAGAFSKSAREPMRSTVIVKGDRMSMVNGDRISVIDVDKETFTDVDMKNRTYSVITFADMARAMQKMSEKMKTNDSDFTVSADVKNTGASRQVNGFDAKETILTMNMEGTDKKSGNKMVMKIVTDMWLAPSMPGYEEVRNFYTKMGQKMSWSPNSGFLSAMSTQPGMSKGMAEIYKEMSKLNGVPVLQVIRMGAGGTGMPSDADINAAQQQAAQEQAAQQQQPQQPVPTAGDVAGSAATGVAAGKMGKLGGLAGLGGGLGGFGRKKKQQQQEEPPQQNAPAQQAQAAPASAPAGGATPPGTLMELTTELTSFSSAAADASKFEVPAGFKQVDHDMQKQLK